MKAVATGPVELKWARKAEVPGAESEDEKSAEGSK